MKHRNIRLWVPFFILTLIVIALFYRLLIGDALFWGEASLQLYPWRWLAFEELSNGRIPYWNPYNGGGTPLLANYQSAILYPPNWLYLVIPSSFAMNLLAIGHIYLAAFGMWHFTHRLEFSTFGRGISMLCFALGTYSIARLGAFPLVQSVAWLPWLFWATDRVLHQRSFGSVGVLGVISSLQLLAGHAQITWYSLLALGVFALWSVQWLIPNLPLYNKIEALLLSFMGLLLGAGAAAWQLFLTAQFLGESQRANGVSFDVLTALSYEPWRLITVVIPNFFGNPADGSYLTPENGIYAEDALYIGFLPLISVAFAIYGWLKWRDFLTHHRVFRSVPLWIMLSVLGAIFAFGNYTLLYPLLYDYVPTFDNFREPVHWLLWPYFAFSILAGIGIHYWSRSQRALYWTRIGGGVGVFLSAGMGLFATFNTVNDQMSEILEIWATGLLAAGCWLIGSAILTLQRPVANPQRSMATWQIAVLLFVAADLGWANSGLNPTVPDDFYERDFSISEPTGRLYWFEDYAEAAKSDQYFKINDYRRAVNRWTNIRTSLLPNINIIDRMPIFNNFDPLQPAVHRRYVELIEASGADSSNLLRAAGISETIGVQPEGWQSGGLNNSYVAPSPAPLIWMVPEAEFVLTLDDVEHLLLDPNWNPEKTVILRGETLDIEPSVAAENVDIQVISNQATAQQYRIESDGSGYLVIAQTWYPGWEARIDGEATELYQANLAFQAIYIPAGTSDINLEYAPTGAELAVTISLLSIFIMTILIAIGLFSTFYEQ